MSLSPYTITLSKNNSFVFVTDSGHTYNVYFDKSSNIFPDERVDEFAVYLGFTCAPPLKVLERNHNPRVGVTIMLIIANFLFANPDAILTYVCSSMDGQDRHRQISFKRWYNSSPLKERFVLLQAKMAETYCGIIYDKNHPELDVIDETFGDLNLNKYDIVQESEELYLLLDEEE